MSRNFRALTLSLAAAGVSLLVSVSAHAKLPPECVERFESKVDGHVTAIDEAMNSRGRLADIGNKLLRIRGDALRYIKGNWAKDCADAAPENRDRMNGYIKATLVPALETLAKALSASASSTAGSESPSAPRRWKRPPAPVGPR